jgi:hypothetical protein
MEKLNLLAGEGLWVLGKICQHKLDILENFLHLWVSMDQWAEALCFVEQFPCKLTVVELLTDWDTARARKVAVCCGGDVELGALQEAPHVFVGSGLISSAAGDKFERKERKSRSVASINRQSRF